MSPDDATTAGDEDVTGRDAEERLIAYVTLLVAGMAVVGWFAWIVVSTEPAVVAVVFLGGSAAFAALSVVVGPLAVRYRRGVDRDWAVRARHATLALVVATVAATAYVLLFGPDPGVVVFGIVLALLSFWVVVPLSMGAISATTGGTSMRGVLLAWPLGNVLAILLFFAPDPDRFSLAGSVLALGEPMRTAALLSVAGLVTAGPTLLGQVVDRVGGEGKGEGSGDGEGEDESEG